MASEAEQARIRNELVPLLASSSTNLVQYADVITSMIQNPSKDEVKMLIRAAVILQRDLAAIIALLVDAGVRESLT